VHNSATARSGDGIYVLEATATDKAGNSVVEAITYSVNRYGSTYYIEPGSRTQALLDEFYSNSLPTHVEVHEINPDYLIEYSVSMEHDETMERLAEATGEGSDVTAASAYSLATAGAANTWKDYTYMVGAPAFSADGVYALTFYSTDAAGNTSTSLT
jgi:hypothetical protein